jgi:uncharacterized protein involved in outer membrane biogenesis
VKTGRPTEGPVRVVVAGDVGLADLSVVQRGAAAPMLRVPRLAVAIKEAIPLESVVTLAALEVEGLDLTAVRDRQGQIDLLALAGPPGVPPGPAPTTPPAAAPVAPPAAAAPMKILVERVALTRGRVALRDEAVAPVTTLALSDVAVTVTNFTWPNTTPLGLEASLGLPTAGRVSVKGTATLTPFSTDLTTSLRGGSIEPYHPYIPFKGRLAGRFNGDSRTQVAIDAQAARPRSRRERAGSRRSRSATPPTSRCR